MGFFDNWPHTDFHRLNLDWVLRKVKDGEVKISELEEIVNDPGRFMMKLADPIEWDILTAYEKFTIVTYQGNSYISRVDVPAGQHITNNDYWARMTDFSAQVEELQRSIEAVNEALADYVPRVEALEDSETQIDGRVGTLESSFNSMESRVDHLHSRMTNPLSYRNVLLIGDSFLQASPSWGSILRELCTPTNWRVQAEGGAGFAAVGQSGHTFADLAQIAKNAIEWTPDLVIIGGGLNDCWQGSGVSNAVSGLANLLSYIEDNWPGCEVHIFGMLWGYTAYGSRYDPYNVALQKKAAAYPAECRVIYHGGCWTWLYGQSELCQSDKKHPNNSGQRVIANNMYDELRGLDTTRYTDKYEASSFVAIRNGLSVTFLMANNNVAVSSVGQVVYTYPEWLRVGWTLFPAYTSRGTMWGEFVTYDVKVKALAGGSSTGFNGIATGYLDGVL